MRDFISLGVTPPFESGCQVGRPNYEKYASLEAREYKRMLEDFVGSYDDITLKVTRNPHDFGYYYDVIIEFESNEEATNHACAVESSIPDRWIDDYGPGYGFLTWNDEVHADEYLSCTLV